MRSRRPTPEWLRSSQGRILVGAAVALLASLVPFLEVPNVRDFVTFLAFVSLAELFEVTLGHGERHSLGLAPGLAFALLGNATADVTHAYAAGAALALVLRRATGHPAPVQEAATRILVVAAVAAMYRAVAGADPLATFGPAEIAPLGLAVVILALLLIDPALRAGEVAVRDRIAFLPVFRGTLGSMAGLHLSIASVGALLALAYPTLEYWALPLFVAPLAATEYAFRQLQSIRTTYLQTIRALSRVPEVAGFTAPGHSARVAELATAIARELGTSKAGTTEIEYAALLHDIGRVSMSDPVPEGGGASRAELAAVGAGIVEQSGYFPHVGWMIRLQHTPYRRRGEDMNREVPVGAKIIRVASTYDDLASTAPRRAPWDALERLHLDTAYEYDPAVIQALMRVLEKQGAI